MRTLLTLAVLSTATLLFASSANAQCQGGCNINTRTQQQQLVPPEVDPLPSSLTSFDRVAADDDFHPVRRGVRQATEADLMRQYRPENERLTVYRPGQPLRVQPVGLGLFANVERTVVQDNSARYEAALAGQNAKIDRLNDRIADLRGQGMSDGEIALVVQREMAAQIDYDRITYEVADRIINSQRFRDGITAIIRAAQASQGAGDIEIEVVPVE